MKIITNTAVSLDGKISTRKDEHVLLGTEKDRERMDLIRARADAILVGGHSFRTWPIPLYSQKRQQNATQARPVFNVVVSRRMNFTLSERYLQDKNIHPLFLTTAKEWAALCPKEEQVEVVTSQSEMTPEWIVAQLKQRGVQTLLIEGGGELIAQFLESHLVDEMYVTLTPKIVGGNESPSLVQGKGFPKDELPQLKLLSSEVIGDEIYLHYRVEKT